MLLNRIEKHRVWKKANHSAITESSVEKLKGGKRLLMSLQQTNLENRTTYMKKNSSSLLMVKTDLIFSILQLQAD
ncbi:hypothetical protein PRO82_000720 [Candidatus Protochlamydia amoebophila]|uniref:hypothetical protein n=1 Tax=Candidatus Protochlamydia amoebophila TaxID=362787 RepID=UPI001BC8FF23|nr:hypothetical protein [Candidatus Protochlamydia amoebophila]MBS4163418.1 hypothetical protein [Candidatus Protochlamydia amoebophila]